MFTYDDNHTGWGALVGSGIEDNLATLGLDQLTAVNLRVMDNAAPNQRFVDQLGALVAARDEGLITGIGISNVTHRHLLTAVEVTDIVCVQNAYNLADRSSEAVLLECAASASSAVITVACELAAKWALSPAGSMSRRRSGDSRCASRQASCPIGPPPVTSTVRPRSSPASFTARSAVAAGSTHAAPRASRPSGTRRRWDGNAAISGARAPVGLRHACSGRRRPWKRTRQRDDLAQRDCGARSFTYTDEFDLAIGLLATGQLVVADLTSVITPLNDALSAFDALRGGRIMKALIAPSHN